MDLEGLYVGVLDLNKLKLELTATIHHIGTVDLGHYFTNIKIGDAWFRFDDHVVDKISILEKKSSSVCMLIYKKIILK